MWPLFLGNMKAVQLFPFLSLWVVHKLSSLSLDRLNNSLWSSQQLSQIQSPWTTLHNSSSTPPSFNNQNNSTFIIVTTTHENGHEPNFKTTAPKTFPVISYDCQDILIAKVKLKLPIRWYFCNFTSVLPWQLLQSKNEFPNLCQNRVHPPSNNSMIRLMQL